MRQMRKGFIAIETVIIIAVAVIFLLAASNLILESSDKARQGLNLLSGLSQQELELSESLWCNPDEIVRKSPEFKVSLAKGDYAKAGTSVDFVTQLYCPPTGLSIGGCWIRELESTQQYQAQVGDDQGTFKFEIPSLKFRDSVVDDSGGAQQLKVHRGSSNVGLETTGSAATVTNVKRSYTYRQKSGPSIGVTALGDFSLSATVKYCCSEGKVWNDEFQTCTAEGSDGSDGKEADVCQTLNGLRVKLKNDQNAGTASKISFCHSESNDCQELDNPTYNDLGQNGEDYNGDYFFPITDIPLELNDNYFIKSEGTDALLIKEWNVTVNGAAVGGGGATCLSTSTGDCSNTGKAQTESIKIGAAVDLDGVRVRTNSGFNFAGTDSAVSIVINGVATQLKTSNHNDFGQNLETGVPDNKLVGGDEFFPLTTIPDPIDSAYLKIGGSDAWFVDEWQILKNGKVVAGGRYLQPYCLSTGGSDCEGQADYVKINSEKERTPNGWICGTSTNSTGSSSSSSSNG